MKWWRFITESLSARITLLYVTVGVLLIALAFILLKGGFNRHFQHNIRPFIFHYVQLLENNIGHPPSPEQARQLTERIPANIHVFGPDEQWSTGPTLLDRSKLHKSHRHERRHQGKLHGHRPPNAPLLQLHRYGENLVYHVKRGQYDIYLQLLNRPKLKDGGPFGLYILLCIALAQVLMYFVIRHWLRPIGDIQRGATEFGKGRFDYVIPKHCNDELGKLTVTVNTMADNIKCMLEAKRQLLLAISHELRSPLTRAKIHLALLPDSQDQQEIANNLNEVETMISELLDNERLEMGHQALQLSTFCWQELAKDVITQHFDASLIQTKFTVQAHAQGDAVRCRLLLKNLLDNALKHSDAKAHPVKLSIWQETTISAQTSIVLSVEDKGKGIHSKHISNLTEPFYRVDSARHRDTGGYGLGLYLCQAIVNAHGGKLDISSTLGQGTTIRCTFPTIQVDS